MADTALTLQNVSFQWDDARAQGGFAVKCPDFSVAKGERVLLLGASGSGKSTLLSIICGIAHPQGGQVCVNGTDISRLRPSRRDRFRAEQIGVIFQQFNLLPYASVADNILLPLRFAPQRRKRAGGRVAVDNLCRALHLPENIGEMTAGRLSVGQQQRVAVARALIGSPPLIVADEPTSALDAASQKGFLDTLFAQARTTEASVLMVSHDARLSDLFDRVVRLDEIVSTTRGAT